MKKSCKVLLGIFALLLASFTSKINAQDCGCDAALIKDKIEYSDEGFEYLHYLQQIDASQYEEIKKSYGASGKYKLIKGSANYQDFQEKVKKDIRNTEIETGRQYKSSYYEARTSSIAYDYWGKCMESCNKIGLLLWIQNESKNSLALILKYRSAPNSNATINYTVTIQHGDGSVETKKGTIVPNGTEPITIKRKCGTTYEISQTNISIKGAGYSSDWVSSKFYCGKPVTGEALVELNACDYNDSQNICKGCHGYGDCMIMNNRSAPQFNKAVYSFTLSGDGVYEVYLKYAAAAKRTIKITMNGKVISESACNGTTGSWESSSAKWEYQGLASGQKGANTIILERGAEFPHIQAIKLVLKK